MHKKCSGIKGRITKSEFTCARCLGTARAIDGRRSLEVEVGNEMQSNVMAASTGCIRNAVALRDA